MGGAPPPIPFAFQPISQWELTDRPTVVGKIYGARSLLGHGRRNSKELEGGSYIKKPRKARRRSWKEFISRKHPPQFGSSSP
jgi:hypothetical protein